MGTAVSLDLADPFDADRLHALADGVFAWLREVDDRFSTYRADSEVNRLQRGALDHREISADLRHVLAECVRLGDETGGWFDAYATGSLDPSGYVKGWSVQVAADRLSAAGAGNFCLNAGGDIRVRGHSSTGRPWRIGVQHPLQRTKLAWVLEVDDTAIATSGAYERGDHVIDPFTGRGATGLSSVTVLGPDLGIADAYATAAFAMGERGIGWLAGHPGHDYAVLAADGRAYTSPGLPSIG
nr:FAD:protein FMN transferase [Allocatelliglobosispora scoriae]